MSRSGGPLRELGTEWKTWLGKWYDEFDEDLPVYFYADDGTDAPDEWADGPHLAISPDWGTPPRSVVWPAGVDGWDDLRDIGWAGAAERVYSPDGSRRDI